MNVRHLSKRTIVVAGVALATVGAGTAALAASDGDVIDGWRGDRLQAEAEITFEQAIAAAEEAAGGSADANEVELERLGDQLLYEVEVGETDVYVDAMTGEVVSVDPDDDGADGDDDEDAGSGLDEGASLLPEAGVTREQAIEAAQTAAEGNVGEIELEREAGRLVYVVEVGASEVTIDANDASVLAVEGDD
jgi:uncharacterized membrane protein YkoI